MSEIKKVVLAYSGGLDTSVIIPWLKEHYDNCEVIAVCGNVGQDDELDDLKQRAVASGASKLYVEDLTDEFVNEFVIPTMQAGADYEGYLYIDNKKIPYADKFIESFFHLYGISGMSYKTSMLREQYLQHLTDSNPSKPIRLLLFNEVCIYAGQDIVKPVIDKIYRRFMRCYPKAVLKIIYDNFKAIITCSCVENNIIHVLDIRYDMLRGEFLAYESIFDNEKLQFLKRITR